jgi:hypothetical protein
MMPNDREWCRSTVEMKMARKNGREDDQRRCCTCYSLLGAAHEHRVIGSDESGRLAMFRPDLKPSVARPYHRNLRSFCDLR